MGPGPLTNGQSACQWHPLNEAADTRMGFWFTLKFNTERFGMAFRLPFTYAFVRPESEHNSSHQRWYWSEPELIDSGVTGALMGALALKMGQLRQICRLCF